MGNNVMVKKINKRIMQKRLFNIDLLKIICCISVILIHVSATYINTISNHMNEIFYINLLNCITRFAVPCFVMISGYFAISNNKNDDCITFYKKKIKSIIIPMIIFSVIYLIYDLTNNILENAISNIKVLLFSFITGNLEYHMWYLYMVIFLYLITQILWKIKDNIGESNFDKIGKVLLIVSIPFALTSTHKFSYDIGFSIYYLGYYILGYTIAKKVKNKSNKKFAFYLLIGLLILFLNSFIRLDILKQGFTDNNFVFPVIGNISVVKELWVLVVIASIFIYKAFRYLDIKINLYCITKYTLYIYMAHIFVLNTLNRLNLHYSVYFIIPLYTILVFLISWIISIIYLFIYSKINRNDIVGRGVDYVIDKIVKRVKQ